MFKKDHPLVHDCLSAVVVVMAGGLPLHKYDCTTPTP